MQIFWDLREFYEHIDRQKLAERSCQQDFDRHVGRLATQAYGYTRFLGIGGPTMDCGFPRRGIIAGCVFATTGVQLYSMPPIKAIMRSREMSLETLKVYLDDYTLQSTGVDDRETARRAFKRGRRAPTSDTRRDGVRYTREEGGCSRHQ